MSPSHTPTKCICDANPRALLDRVKRLILGEIPCLMNLNACQFIRRNFDTYCRSDVGVQSGIDPLWTSSCVGALRKRAEGGGGGMSLLSRFKKPLHSSVVIQLKSPCLLTPKQAALYIGHSVDLVREMVAKREIPHVPKGNGEQRTHYLIDRLDLDRWVEKSKVGTPAT
jgi:excisionase family DNA binding protein